MSKGTIWLINQYASTPDTGMGGRHYYLARSLVQRGYTVYVIAAGHTHLLRKPHQFEGDFKFEEVEGIHYVWVKTAPYKFAHEKKRILNWLRFSWKIRKLPGLVKHKPDVVLCSSPSLISFLGTRSTAKKTGAKLVFEVRDIWPLSLMDIGGYSSKHPFIRFLQGVENSAYRDSDYVISNLPNAVDHMVEHGLEREKFSWVPNGFSMEEVEKADPLDAAIAEQLPKGKFLIGYTGSVGLSNALGFLVEAADMLKADKDIAVVIVGQGADRKILRKMVAERNLSNVVFIDAIPKIQIQSMLSRLDVCFMGLLKSDLFKFGISPNKLFDYLYSGRPILYSVDSGKYRPVDELGAGISVPPEDAKAIAEAILKFKAMTPKQRDEMGALGRQNAIDNYEYDYLAGKLAKSVGLDKSK